MDRKRHKPPPGKRDLYIYMHMAAILDKGIAAFFYSTDFYVSSAISIYCNGVLSFCTGFFVEVWAFLFKPKPDKPPPCPTVHIPRAWQCYIAKYP